VSTEPAAAHTARFIEAVLVKATRDELTVWDGLVYVFRLNSNLLSDIVSAWAELENNGKSEELISFLHIPPICGPRDAVRAFLLPAPASERTGA